MILIIGKSTLAKQLQSIISDSVVVGRPEYDLSSKESCDKLISDYQPTLLINTQAVNESHDSWEILSTNYVGIVYLTIGFYNKMPDGQIINVSSASTFWPSWPNISDGRLCYNISKESLSTFGKHFNRKIIDNVDKKTKVSTVELGKFNSKFNNFSGGMNIDKAASIIKFCVDHPMELISCLY